MIPSPYVLAQLCAQSYTSPADIQADGLHLTFFPVGDALVAVFRGSADREDWLDNLKIAGRRSTAHPQLGEVCSGFADDVIAQYPAIRAALAAQWAGFPLHDALVLAGHSRGGAQAQTLAGLLAADGVKIDSLVTFGAARVCGDDALPGLIGKLPGADFDNSNDPVVFLPPNYSGPRARTHVGEPRRLRICVEDHFMSAYCASIGPSYRIAA